MLDILQSLFKTKVSIYGQSNFVSPTTLYPEELQYVRNASPSRQSEFATGRYCARIALEKLGIARTPILRRPSGPAIWPDGIVGSISHCETFCVSVATTRDYALSVGIDVEINSVLPFNEAELICSEEEIDLIKSQNALTFYEWVNLSFSAKEAFFKCYFSVSETFLDFHDATVSFTHDENMCSGDYSIKLRSHGDSQTHEHAFLGRWYIDCERVYTGMVLIARNRSSFRS